MAYALSLVVRNLVFTVVVPGLGGVWVPWRIATGHGGHGVAIAAAGWVAVVCPEREGESDVGG